MASPAAPAKLASPPSVNDTPMAVPHAHHLTRQIVIAMLAGIVIGVALNLAGPGPCPQTFVVDGVLHVVGTVFVSALKMMVVPLVFVSLVAGVTALSDLKTLGRIGAKALGLYLTTTAIAVTIALALAGAVGPGGGFDASETQAPFSGKEAPPLTKVLIDLVPTNPVAAMAEGNMLQVIVFTLLFGMAITMSGARGKHVLNLFSDLNSVIMHMVDRSAGRGHRAHHRRRPPARHDAHRRQRHRRRRDQLHSRQERTRLRSGDFRRPRRRLGRGRHAPAPFLSHRLTPCSIR